MDSLERLGHSLEQVIALIHALKREKRELSEEASRAAALLAAARLEVERLRQEPSADLESVARARAAELETATMAEQLEKERTQWKEGKQRLQAQLQDLELRLLAAERNETMPIPAV